MNECIGMSFSCLSLFVYLSMMQYLWCIGLKQLVSKMDGCLNINMDIRKYMYIIVGCLLGWTDRWIDGWIDGQ